MRQRIKFERPDKDFKLSVSSEMLGFSIVNDMDDPETVINVQGVIGDAWDGLDCHTVVETIQNIQTPIRMRLNTPGGYVFEALDVYDALVEHPHTVIADIVSQAASAGTILASAADEIRIRPAAEFMIHRAWNGLLLMGNEEDMRDQLKAVEDNISFLQRLDEQLAQLLADRSGNDIEQVREWLRGPEGVDGTSFIGQEAVDAGFADELIENKKKKSLADQKETFQQKTRANALRLIQLKAAS